MSLFRLGDLNHIFNQEFTKINELLDDFMSPSKVSSLKQKMKNSSFPKWDVYRKDNSFCIDIALPGMDKEDISVSIEETEDKVRYIRVEGTSVNDNESSNSVYYHKELRKGTFSRTYLLPEDITGDPETNWDNGILHISWKLANTKPKTNIKQIPIK